MTAIFSRFLKVAIPTSSFISEANNGRFAPKFSVSLLEETIALVQDFVSETRKNSRKINVKTKYEIFVQ